jgi:hypothetical protein
MFAMKKCAIVLLAVLAASASANAARPPHPWCMVVQDRSGIWACAFDSFEQCYEEARPGNMGFCARNPSYPPPIAHAKPAHRRPNESR